MTVCVAANKSLGQSLEFENRISCELDQQIQQQDLLSEFVLVLYGHRGLEEHEGEQMTLFLCEM